jgi:TolB protein
MTVRKACLAGTLSLLVALSMWLGLSGELLVQAEGATTANLTLPSQSSTDGPMISGAVASKSKVYIPLVQYAAPEKIAFERRLEGQYDIYLMHPDGSNQVNLTNHPANDTSPAWSPDGRRIAFVSTRSGNNEEIHLMNRDGTGIVRLTSSPGRDGWPTWSPDGTQIAFQSDRSGDFQIYVMNADGSGQRPITDDPTRARWPDWSPDGTRITFTSRRVGFTTKIFVMNADGSNLRVLSDPNGPYDDRYSTWSPDGRITFVSDQPAPSDGTRDDEIYIMTATGSNPRQLTDNDDGDWLARWSPDGTRFAFYSNRTGKKSIFVKTLASGLEAQLTSDTWDEEYPSWSP